MSVSISLFKHVRFPADFVPWRIVMQNVASKVIHEYIILFRRLLLQVPTQIEKFLLFYGDKRMN